MKPNNIGLSEELAFAKGLVINAAEFIQQPLEVETKEDGTPVTEIDKRISEYIFSQLKSVFPDYAILDEETEDDGSRFEREYCWVIDPLDDTRGFVQGGRDFGILIGLTRGFKPVLGVTYKPRKKELAYAVIGQGAYMEVNGAGERIAVEPSEKRSVFVSESRSDNEELEEMLRRTDPDWVGYMGGALKAVEVARGRSTLYLCPTNFKIHLWDLCATQVILEEAGGRITDIRGNPIDYSRKETSHNLGVIASNRIIHDDIVERLNH